MAEEPEAASDRSDDADDGDVIQPDESALGKVYQLARLLVALSHVDVISANAATAIITAWHDLSAADKVPIRFPSRTVAQQKAGTWMHKAPYKASAVPGADSSSKAFAGTVARAPTSPGCHRLISAICTILLEKHVGTTTTAGIRMDRFRKTVRDYSHISRVVMADDRIVGASEVALPDINVNTLKKW